MAIEIREKQVEVCMGRGWCRGSLIKKIIKEGSICPSLHNGQDVIEAILDTTGNCQDPFVKLVVEHTIGLGR